MYLEFFGLTDKPFDLVPNPRFLYQSQSHRKALNYLYYGIQQKMGFILFTGEVGSGKTTILRGLIQNVDADTQVSMVFNTRISDYELLTMINEDFNLPTEGKDKPALLRDLNNFLIAQHALGHQPIIIIDEAQNLSPEALEEIRLLSNLETNELKLVQIILVGQPELRSVINRNSLRQLRQRINIHCHLEPLQRDEVDGYILHRLDIAGNREALTFQEGVLDLIFEHSGGIPRIINLLCDFVLLAAFSDGTQDISLQLVEEVLNDISWKGNGSNEDPEGKNPTPKNTLGKHLLNRLGALENKIQQVSMALATMTEEQKKCKKIEELSGEIHLNKIRLKRIEESLTRIERQLHKEVGGEMGRAAVVHLQPEGRNKGGLFARILG